MELMHFANQAYFLLQELSIACMFVLLSMIDTTE